VVGRRLGLLVRRLLFGLVGERLGGRGLVARARLVARLVVGEARLPEGVRRVVLVGRGRVGIDLRGLTVGGVGAVVGELAVGVVRGRFVGLGGLLLVGVLLLLFLLLLAVVVVRGLFVGLGVATERI